jgi:hypothetical protein
MPCCEQFTPPSQPLPHDCRYILSNQAEDPRDFSKRQTRTMRYWKDIYTHGSTSHMDSAQAHPDATLADFAPSMAFLGGPWPLATHRRSRQRRSRLVVVALWFCFACPGYGGPMWILDCVLIVCEWIGQYPFLHSN